MCGIVGYTGFRDAYDVVINGLRRLEYRGYDSAGVILESQNGDLEFKKTKGKVDDLVAISKGLKETAKLEWDIQDGLLMEFQVIIILIHIFQTMEK
jgi:glucosamine--fructose-6-phosphate aminotransferase (isomerizing)